MKTFLRKFFPVFLLAALLLGALPTQPAFAASPADDATPQPADRVNRLLERKFKAEQRRYEAQGKLFDASFDLMERAQAAIDRAQEKGIDTTAAETALADLQTAIANAKPLYDKAGAELTAHAGFDAGGKVTDAEEAAQTVEDAHKLLDQVRDDTHAERETLQHALWDLFQEMLKG